MNPTRYNRSMNTERWDAIADRFARGELLPANGTAAWKDAACDEARRIRLILPPEVETLLEVGCGVGRLTPYLALMFRRVIATDTSSACRRVTRIACLHRPNVVVCRPDEAVVFPAPDAALVWGNLYDDDWTDQVATDHLAGLLETHRCVLVQTERPALRERFVPVLTGDDWMLLR